MSKAMAWFIVIVLALFFIKHPNELNQILNDLTQTLNGG